MYAFASFNVVISVFSAHLMKNYLKSNVVCAVIRKMTAYFSFFFLFSVKYTNAFSVYKIDVCIPCFQCPWADTRAKITVATRPQDFLFQNQFSSVYVGLVELS